MLEAKKLVGLEGNAPPSRAYQTRVLTFGRQALLVPDIGYDPI